MGHDMTNSFIVSGSHGRVLVDAESGVPVRVLEPCEEEGKVCEDGCLPGDSYYMEMVFDTLEWQLTYPGLGVQPP